MISSKYPITELFLIGF